MVRQSGAHRSEDRGRKLRAGKKQCPRQLCEAPQDRTTRVHHCRFRVDGHTIGVRYAALTTGSGTSSRNTDDSRYVGVDYSCFTDWRRAEEGPEVGVDVDERKDVSEMIARHQDCLHPSAESRLNIIDELMSIRTQGYWDRCNSLINQTVYRGNGLGSCSTKVAQAIA